MIRRTTIKGIAGVTIELHLDCYGFGDIMELDYDKVYVYKVIPHE
jgi:hypothetical protein